MMFTTIHFTELKDLAVRGQIERGMRYLECHDSRFDPNNDLSGAAIAYEILTLSYVRPVRYALWTPDSYIEKWPLKFRMGHIDKVHNFQRERHASDAGLNDLPGSYGNPWNYLLDIADLRRKGIIVDTTPIPRREEF